MRRIPFLSQSDRRALLLLEWLLLLLLIGLFVWKGVPRGSKGPSHPMATDSLRHQGKSRPQFYAKDEEPVETFAFDPNTADSTTLLRLGLAPWQVRAVYNYRARHGRYHTPEDFQYLPGMTNELWERLSPYIRIDRRFQLVTPSSPRRYARPSASAPSSSGHRSLADTSVSAPDDSVSAEKRSTTVGDSVSRTSSQNPLALGEGDQDTILHPVKYAPGTVIDLNAADTSMLKKIPGIASYRASKIVEYRQRLGGFRTKEQVMEACKMPDEVLEWFTVKPVPLENLQGNHLSLQRLMRHPYISFYQARAIVEYRQKHGPLHGPQELQNLQDFTPQAIERVCDYLDFRE